MDAYDVCVECACHIKREELACPFCAAPHAPKPLPAIRWSPRMSRAQWLAFGSTLAVAGCTEHVPRPLPSDQVADATIPQGDAAHEAMTAAWDAAMAPEADAFDEAAVPETDALAVLEADTSLEGGRDGAADALVDSSSGFCVIPSGTFICDPSPNGPGNGGSDGGVSCGRATQYCALWPSAVRGCLSNTDVDAQPYPGAPFPPECVACPTCACIRGYPRWMGSHGCECSNLDDAGAIGISCGGCYGSPPARLERLLNASS